MTHKDGETHIENAASLSATDDYALNQNDQGAATNSRAVHVPLTYASQVRPTANINLVVDSTEKAAIDLAARRIGQLALLFMFGFMVLAIRLFDVAVFGTPPAWLTAGPSVATPGAPPRADILDRNGVVLAGSLDTVSLAANPRKVKRPEQLARKIAFVLPDVDPASLTKKLSSDRQFVWISRHLTPEQHYQVNALGDPALIMTPEVKRIYPQGALLAHTVGYVDVDNTGLAGVELSLDNRLTQEHGRPLRLTLDVRLQHALQQELMAAVSTFRAKAAAGVLVDVRTGEVLALSSLPTFDPHNPGGASNFTRNHRAVNGRFELGSTFKMFTAAMTLDSGAVNLGSVFDARKPLQSGGFTVKDYHPENRKLTLPEVIMHSSNIGAAMMIQTIPVDVQVSYLRQLGLLDAVPVELMEASHPLPPRQWGPTERVTVSYGHGIAVSPLHIASAMGGLANGGELVAATLLPRDPSKPLVTRRIVSPQTSAVMRSLMRLVVEQGTGKKAEVAGLYVGGKTGTANKPDRGGYSASKKITSFSAVFPVHDPRYSLFVMLDEPKGNEATYGFSTGGWTAAPTAGAIIRRVGPILGLVPEADTSNGIKQVRALSILMAMHDEGRAQ
ncbi:MAG: penicillin-binding protein 2 [Alphaproteobacteria bacterium]